MKRLIVISLAALMLAGCFATGNRSYTPDEKTRYYDNHGRYSGYSIKSPSGERFYSKDGKFIGKAVK